MRNGGGEFLRSWKNSRSSSMSRHPRTPSLRQRRGIGTAALPRGENDEDISYGKIIEMNTKREGFKLLPLCSKLETRNSTPFPRPAAPPASYRHAAWRRQRK